VGAFQKHLETEEGKGADYGEWLLANHRDQLDAWRSLNPNAAPNTPA
jgi:hypothetical protein